MISLESNRYLSGSLAVTFFSNAELFEDDSVNNSIALVDGRVDDAIGGRSYGIGIRIFKGLNSVYAYTNNN